MHPYFARSSKSRRLECFLFLLRSQILRPVLHRLHACSSFYDHLHILLCATYIIHTSVVYLLIDKTLYIIHLSLFCAGMHRRRCTSFTFRYSHAHDSGRPDSGRPDSGRPDSGRLDSGRPDICRPDSGRPDIDCGRPDSGGPDTDSGRPDSGRPDSGGHRCSLIFKGMKQRNSYVW